MHHDCMDCDKDLTLLISPRIAQHRHIVARTKGGRALRYTHALPCDAKLYKEFLWPLAMMWGFHKPWLLDFTTKDIVVETINPARIIGQRSILQPLPQNHLHI